MNGYTNDYQNISNSSIDITNLNKEDRIAFVPEYLNIELDDIFIELLN
jgi:hypothetical protein